MLGNKKVWKFTVVAKVRDVIYPKQVYWVEQGTYLQLKVQSYSLSASPPALPRLPLCLRLPQAPPAGAPRLRGKPGGGHPMKSTKTSSSPKAKLLHLWRRLLTTNCKNRPTKNQLPFLGRSIAVTLIP